MEEIIGLLVNNGVAVAVVGYFLYRDYRLHDDLITTLQRLVDVVENVRNAIVATACQTQEEKGEKENDV